MGQAKMPRAWRLGLHDGIQSGAVALLVLAAAVFLQAGVLLPSRSISAQPPNPQVSDAKTAGQTTPGQSQPPLVLKSERNLVLIRAVVRNSKGNVVDNLHQQDFRVFDNGKPQQITDFSLLRAGTKAPAAQPPPEHTGVTSQPEAQPHAPSTPHFIAFYFDDYNLEVNSAVPVRQAAQEFLKTAWHPGDFAGVFTATGHTELDFTSDLAKVQTAVSKIMARPKSTDSHDCPDIIPYQAYLIAEEHDQSAEDLAVGEGMRCECDRTGQSGVTPGMPDTCLKMVEQEVRAKASALWNFTRLQSQSLFERMESLITRMETLHGDRTLVLVSPGVLTSAHDQTIDGLVDRAIRAGVAVNSLDARGLFVLPPGEHTEHVVGGPDYAEKVMLVHTEADWVSDPLRELAQGTGGTFFHNDNDLVTGFRETTSPPAVEYLIGFSPQNLKLNGAYHSLKVQIVGAGKFEIQARRGYTSPTKAEETQAKRPDPIETALYSTNSSQAFPVEVQIQSSHSQESHSTLTVSVHVDIHHVNFRKHLGRYAGLLVFRTALFDPSRQYITGNQRDLNLDLDEERFADLSHKGINAVTQLVAAPGDYVLREVVEDKTTGKLSALSQPIKVQ